MKAPTLTRLTERQARELLEELRWPNGPYCPHCGNADGARITAMKGATTRAGLYKCNECRKPFTVTVATVMERSRIPMWQWVYAFARMCASKKGISAHQLHRELEVTYKTAWFLCHRIRYAMREDGPAGLGGPGHVIEADETLVGGKPRYPKPAGTTSGHEGKSIVLTLVQRGGKARSKVVTDVSAFTLRGHLTRHAHLGSRLMTDEHKGYLWPGSKFASHETVNHSKREYARGDAFSNTAESYFSLLKRGVYGIFHHVSKEHLQRYVDEFDFRWSNHRDTDRERTNKAIAQTTGKRLTYRKTVERGPQEGAPDRSQGAGA